MIYEYHCPCCLNTFLGEGTPREICQCGNEADLVAIDGDPIDWHPLRDPR